MRSDHDRLHDILDLSELDETLDILSQPGALAEIRESAEDIAAGRTVSIEEVRAEFGRDRESRDTTSMHSKSRDER